MFDDSTYDWGAEDAMTATLPRPADKPVRRTLNFPLPPVPPEGAVFWEYRIDTPLRHTGCAAPDLERAVAEYLARGTDSTLSVRVSKYIPCTAECQAFHGDKHDEEAKCGDWISVSVFNPHSETWGPWKAE